MYTISSFVIWQLYCILYTEISLFQRVYAIFWHQILQSLKPYGNHAVISNKQQFFVNYHN